MVREGDLNYQSAIAKANLMSNGVRTGGANPTIQAIVSCTSFTSLCVRVAIQAGLSPDTAYSVGDSYIQSMVECKTIAELRSINHAMYEDFTMRVHRHRTNPKGSNPIQACRDYIEVHTGEVLNLGILPADCRHEAPAVPAEIQADLEPPGIRDPLRQRISKKTVQKASILLACFHTMWYIFFTKKYWEVRSCLFRKTF